MNDLANGVIDGNEALGVQLAEGHMNGPLSRSGLPQAVEGEIGALTEAHAGVADEQEGIAGYIVATQEFLLNEAILFETQRAWQAVIAFGDVVGGEQTEQGGEFVEPSQFFQQTTQRNDVQGTGGASDGWLL